MSSNDRLGEIRERVQSAAEGWPTVVKYVDCSLDDTSFLLAEVKRLHEMNRWIPVDERLPGKNDANEYGEVHAWRRGRCMRVSHKNVSPATATHWRPIYGPEYD